LNLVGWFHVHIRPTNRIHTFLCLIKIKSTHTIYRNCGNTRATNYSKHEAHLASKDSITIFYFTCTLRDIQDENIKEPHKDLLCNLGY
jgi:hypothetical protein